MPSSGPTSQEARSSSRVSATPCGTLPPPARPSGFEHAAPAAGADPPVDQKVAGSCPAERAPLHFLLADKTWDSEYAPTSASGSFGCDVRVYGLGSVRSREGQKEEVEVHGKHSDPWRWLRRPQHSLRGSRAVAPAARGPRRGRRRSLLHRF